MFGGPKLRCSIAENLAAMYRAAFQTVKEWRFWALEIENAAARSLPLALVLKGEVSPYFWDSRPFACNLREAYEGFPRFRAVNASIGAMFEGTAFTEADIRMKNAGLQRAMYARTLSVLHQPTLTPTLCRRVASNYGLVVSPEVVTQTLAFMKTFPLFVSMPLVKTLLGGWTTSVRMHESVLMPCIFGCRGQDDVLSHYVICPRLWRSVRFATSIAPAESWLERLGLTCDHTAVHNLYVAFTTYHTSRHRYIDCKHSNMHS